jgi:hypothetical protein
VQDCQTDNPQSEERRGSDEKDRSSLSPPGDGVWNRSEDGGGAWTRPAEEGTWATRPNRKLKRKFRKRSVSITFSNIGTDVIIRVPIKYGSLTFITTVYDELYPFLLFIFRKCVVRKVLLI